MPKRKSNAQLKRLKKRAKQRGEEYNEAEAIGEAMEPVNDRGGQTSDVNNKAVNKEVENQGQDCVDSVVETDDERIKVTKENEVHILEKRKIASALKKELNDIDNNKEMKAKERRSAKRKAEAIAVQKSGVSSAQELLEWLDTSGTKPINKGIAALPNGTTPSILFIGQLTFDTTKEDILKCVRAHLKENEDIVLGDEAFAVRLLTNPKNGKSKGMAFLEIKDPDPKLLFSCLKLHHTYLNGRRINVERTSGGGKKSREAKIASLRKGQVEYMKDTVQTILSEYDTSSLDEGALALCERHNATIVHAAMERYVETDGRNKENPSAYLTALLQKLATEGVFDRTKKDGKNSGGKATLNRGRSRREKK